MAYLSHYKMLPLTLLKIQFGSLFFTHVASSTNCCSQQALCHSSPPNICPFPFFFTSVHFHWLSKEYGVCHCLHSL